jgi:hypothetical protein
LPASDFLMLARRPLLHHITLMMLSGVFFRSLADGTINQFPSTKDLESKSWCLNHNAHLGGNSKFFQNFRSKNKTLGEHF